MADEMNIKNASGCFSSMIQNINVSIDAGREELWELGRRGPYYKFMHFPVEISGYPDILEISGVK